MLLDPSFQRGSQGVNIYMVGSFLGFSCWSGFNVATILGDPDPPPPHPSLWPPEKKQKTKKQNKKNNKKKQDKTKKQKNRH